jgi:hypothetical protein
MDIKISKKSTFLNSTGFKSFTGFETLKESQLIADFLNTNVDILNISAIERLSGICYHNLWYLMSGKYKTIHPDSIAGLLPVLKRVGFEIPPKIITMVIIQNMVTRFYGISLDRINSNLSPRDVSKARQLCMYFSVQMTDNNYETIGAFFGNRDHSTVSYAIKTINELIDTDPKIRKQVDYLHKRIKPS